MKKSNIILGNLNFFAFQQLYQFITQEFVELNVSWKPYFDARPTILICKDQPKQEVFRMFLSLEIFDPAEYFEEEVLNNNLENKNDLTLSFEHPQIDPVSIVVKVDNFDDSSFIEKIKEILQQPIAQKETSDSNEEYSNTIVNQVYEILIKKLDGYIENITELVEQKDNQ